jgi:hypothetical protein
MCPPGGVAPLLAPNTRQVNTSAGAPVAPGVAGGKVTKETVGLPRDFAPPASAGLSCWIALVVLSARNSRHEP